MSVTLVVAGDLCAAGSLTEPLSSSGAGNLWREIAELNKAAGFGDRQSRVPTDRSPATCAQVWSESRAPSRCMSGISAARFTAACLANNHIMDAGPPGLFDTLETCREAGMLTVGAGEDASAAWRTVARDSRRAQAWRTGNRGERVLYDIGSATRRLPLDTIDNGRQISALRRESDFILVLLHGGPKGTPSPVHRCRSDAAISSTWARTP